MTCIFPIETKRLALRRMNAGDLVRFSNYRADAELARYQGWKPMSLEEAAVFVDEMSRAPAFVQGAWLQIAIAELPGRDIVGDIGFCLHAGGELEIGFTMRQESQGKGYVTEALCALLGELLSRPDVRRVIAVTDSRNEASIRVLECIGMAQVSSEDVLFKGELCVELRYQMEGR